MSRNRCRETRQVHRNLIMNVSTKRQRIAELGKRFDQRSFTSLHHHLDLEWLTEAYRRLNSKSAPGADGVTVEEYGKDLRSNLASLRERVLGGVYHAPSVRRVWIPKGSGGNEKRPIGIPTTEDKVLQRAVQMLLEPLSGSSVRPTHFTIGLARSRDCRGMRFGGNLGTSYSIWDCDK